MKTYKVELTEEFIKEAHSVACDEWKTKIKDLVPEAFENQFDVGKWYRHKSMNWLVCVTKNVENRKGGYGYGFTMDGSWNNRMMLIDYKEWKLATVKEVEEALIKEAKKRGLVNRAEIMCLHDKTLQKKNNEKYCFALAYNELWSGTGILLFENGKWAKPIENPTLKRIEEIEAELKQLKEKL